MNILLTNDDGVFSPGLKALYDVLSDIHDVFVIAPEHERSGSSHCITLKDAIKINHAENETYMCSGSPVDCIVVGILGKDFPKPDFIISGINLGPNLGTDIIYSGTVAAARQGALMGVPSMAISLCTYGKERFFKAAKEFVLKKIHIFKEIWEPEFLFNINVPNIPNADLKFKITKPSRRKYSDNLLDFAVSGNETYFFMKSDCPPESIEEHESDWDAIQNGYISLSPLFIHPVNHKEAERFGALLSNWREK